MVFWKLFIIAENNSAVGDDVGDGVGDQSSRVVVSTPCPGSSFCNVVIGGVGGCLSAVEVAAVADGSISFGDVSLNLLFSIFTSSFPLSIGSLSSCIA